jgi:hypothetical protein
MWPRIFSLWLIEGTPNLHLNVNRWFVSSVSLFQINLQIPGHLTRASNFGYHCYIAKSLIPCHIFCLSLAYKLIERRVGIQTRLFKLLHTKLAFHMGGGGHFQQEPWFVCCRPTWQEKTVSVVHSPQHAIICESWIDHLKRPWLPLFPWRKNSSMKTLWKTALTSTVWVLTVG